MFGHSKGKKTGKESGKGSQTDDSMWTRGEHGNDDALQALKYLAKRSNWMKVGIVALMITSILAIIVCSQDHGTIIQMQDQVDKAQDVNQTEKPGKSAALQAVRSWLSNTNSNPYPKGYSTLVWDGATKVGSKEKKDSMDSGTGTIHEEMWSHRFSFVSLADNSTKRVAQLVQVSNGLQTPLGSPTVLPPDNMDTKSGNSVPAPDGWPEMDDDNGNVETIVKQWAKAYVGSDQDALTVLVGDSDSSHVYLPARLGEYRSAATNWKVWAGDGDYSDRKSIKEGSKLVAASVTIQYMPKFADTKGSPSSTDLTVLIANPSSGNAKVVAWGADGDIKHLKKYCNAVHKSDVSRDQPDDSSNTGDTNPNVDGSNGSNAGKPDTGTGSNGGTDSNDSDASGDGN
jgi:hypothetical protein